MQENVKSVHQNPQNMMEKYKRKSKYMESSVHGLKNSMLLKWQSIHRFSAILNRIPFSFLGSVL